MIPWLTSSSRVRLCWSLSWRTAWRQRRGDQTVSDVPEGEEQKLQWRTSELLKLSYCLLMSTSPSKMLTWLSTDAFGLTWRGPALPPCLSLAVKPSSHFLLCLSFFFKKLRRRVQRVCAQCTTHFLFPHMCVWLFAKCRCETYSWFKETVMYRL